MVVVVEVGEGVVVVEGLWGGEEEDSGIGALEEEDVDVAVMVGVRREGTDTRAERGFRIVRERVLRCFC